MFSLEPQSLDPFEFSFIALQKWNKFFNSIVTEEDLTINGNLTRYFQQN